MLDFEDLYQTYAPEVYRFSFWLAGDNAEAEDITTETFIRAWTNSKPPRTETLKAYLFVIARNLYLEQNRKEKRQVPLEDHYPDPTPGPEKVTESRTELQEIIERLKAFSEIDRSAFILRVQHELPYAEIARVLGISISLMLFYAVYDIMKEAINKLLGEVPSPELIKEIKKIIFELEKKEIFAHHFHIHNYGKHRELTFHIKLDGIILSGPYDVWSIQVIGIKGSFAFRMKRPQVITHGEVVEFICIVQGSFPGLVDFVNVDFVVDQEPGHFQLSLNSGICKCSIPRRCCSVNRSTLFDKIFCYFDFIVFNGMNEGCLILTELIDIRSQLYKKFNHLILVMLNSISKGCQLVFSIISIHIMVFEESLNSCQISLANFVEWEWTIDVCLRENSTNGKQQPGYQYVTKVFLHPFNFGLS